MKKRLLLLLFIPIYVSAQQAINPLPAHTIEHNSIIDFPQSDVTFSIHANSMLDLPFSLGDALKRKPNRDLVFSIPKAFISTGNRLDFRHKAEIGLLNFGYKFGKNRRNYISLSNSIVSSVDLDFNTDFLRYLLEGNYNYIGSPVSQDRKGLGLLVYNSTSLGYSRRINSKWTLGFRAKYLTGLMNINFERLNIDLYTSNPIVEPSFYTQVKYNMLINTSGISVGPTVFNDTGYAFDVGAEYTHSDRWTLSAAVKDIGLINWHKSNNLTLFQDSVILVNNLLDESSLEVDISSKIRNQIDSLVELFKLDSIKTSYSTKLPLEYYISANYSFSKNAALFAMFKSRVIHLHAYNSIHFDYTQRFKTWFKTHIYYSIINDSYSNFGLGLSISSNKVDLHISTYNIMSADLIRAEKLSINLKISYKLNRPNRKLLKIFPNYKNRF